MNRDHGPISVCFTIFIMAVLASSCTVVKPSNAPCRFGVYSNGINKLVLSDGTRTGGSPQTAYTFLDGRRGVLGAEKADIECVSGLVYDDKKKPYKPEPMNETDVSFTSDGLVLAGRIIVPNREAGQTMPLAVFVHGSERTGTVGRSRYPWILAAQGVSVFVYDKRGTGGSEGRYTQDFEVLARDAVAAFKTANEAAGTHHDRVGFFGGSQGGWVAPLAATQVEANFLVVGFGLILSPVEEDAEQVFEELRRQGYGAAELAKAKLITDATGEIVSSHFTLGIDSLIDLRNRFKTESWLDTIEGEYTGSLIKASEQELRDGTIPGFEDDNVDWRYDALKVIRSLSIPQLWVIAENDRAAPGQLTHDRLKMLQKEGMQITTALFPDTDHGMIEYNERPDGTREYTKFTKGYFRLIADNMKKTVNAPYGKAKIVTAPHQQQ
ncbi:MAG: hypothetical protein Pars2KO_28940 [Parasphingorhabdus sp.]